MHLILTCFDFGCHHSTLRPNPKQLTYKRIWIQPFPLCAIYLSSSHNFLCVVFYVFFMHSTMASKISKTSTKKKSSKGSASSSSTEPILKDTMQIFSLDPMDYDKSFFVIVEFISSIPLLLHLPKSPTLTCTNWLQGWIQGQRIQEIGCS